MIEIKNLSKKIKKTYVLRDINFKFEKGKIYGLFGRNGSGKTMLLRSIAGLIIPTEGQILVEDKELHKDISFPKNLGIIIENMELLPQFDAYKNLEILAKIKKVASEQDIKESIKRVGLLNVQDLKLRKYSLGMKQRLNIAQAIFEKPDLLLLDEPTNAIDENGVKLINQILLEEKKRGCTIIIATHLKDDIISICDEILHLDDGRIYHE